MLTANGGIHAQLYFLQYDAYFIIDVITESVWTFRSSLSQFKYLQAD